MSRKILLLNVVLVLLLGWLGMRLRSNWLQSQAQQEATFNRTPTPTPVVPPAPIETAEAPSAGEYLNVVQQTLFSQDRNPDEVITVEQPPPPPPPPPVPPFPAYHGQMSFGEPVIVLSTQGSQQQKSYHVGDQVGEFKLTAFDRETMTLEWNDKTLKPNLAELRPKEAVQQAAAPAAQTPQPAAAGPSVVSIGGKSAAKSDPAMGDQRGAYRDCVLGDTSPNGTVKDGYRKVVAQTLMGESCHWEPIH